MLWAWDRIQDEAKSRGFRLIIAGDGPEYGRLSKYIKNNGLKNAFLIGRVADMDRLYRDAYCFVLPSRTEGFPMVILEAFSHGVPVIARDVRTGPREIVDDAKNGYLVRGDEEFPEKMRYLMDHADVRDHLAGNALVRVEDFGIEKIVSEWENLLKVI